MMIYETKLKQKNILNSAKIDNKVNQPEKSTVQMVKVRSESIVDDLKYFPNFHNNYLFRKKTIDWAWKIPPDIWSDKARLKDKVETERDQIDYERLSPHTLVSKQNLREFLGDGAMEHMYVHNADAIHIASRNRDKLPHPTLIGGDPDVTCAGTLHKKWDPVNKSRYLGVRVTKDSGHFRPTSLPATTTTLIGTLAEQTAYGN